MKNIRNSLLILAMLAFTLSCSNDVEPVTDADAQPDQTSESASATNTEISSSTNNTSKLNTQCLADNIKDLNALVPLEEVLALTNKTEEGLTTQYQDMYKESYAYSWDGDTGRKVDVNGHLYDREDGLAIMIQDDDDSLAFFTRGYMPVAQSVADDQFETLAKEVQLALKGNSSKAQMNDAVSKMREAGQSDEEIVASLTPKSTSVITEDTKKAITGVGDAAVWEFDSRYLYLNDNEMTIMISADFNEDADKDLAIATAFYDKIKKACA